MARTQRQKDADAALELALIEASHAYLEGDDGAIIGTMTDWIVVTAEVKPNMDDPDEDVTVYSVMSTGGGLPLYRALGLLQCGLKYINGATIDDE
jgi:hypothetical protein